MEQGIREGKIKSKAETVINLISTTKMSVDEAMKILKVDSDYKKHIENDLKQREIKYAE